MKKYALWSALLLLPACSGSQKDQEPAAPKDSDKQSFFRSRGLLPQKVAAFNAEVDGYGQHDYAREFNAGLTAKVIVVGKKAPFLALYVFDADGNCLGHDDDVEPLTPNELAVEWIPSRTGLCSFQVTALTRAGNEYLLAARPALAP